MRDKILEIAEQAFYTALTFVLTALMVYLFSLQFGFDWSLLLSACVWMALWALRFFTTEGRRD